MLYSVTRNEGFFVAAIIAQPLAILSLALSVRETFSTFNVLVNIYYIAGIRVAPPTTSTLCILIFKFYA
jgi:hypothetical protein